MNRDLIKAYNEIEMLNSLELPIPKEKTREISQLEDSFLKKELFPFIQNMLKPILENYQGKLSISVSYDKETGVQVSKLMTPTVQDSTTRSKNDSFDTAKDGLYFIKSGVVNACATINGNNAIVLKGSKVKTESVSSYKRPEKRAAKLHQTAKNCGEFCILEEDISFNSVSGAAEFCLGRSVDGWNAWKDKFGNKITRK